MGGLVPPAGPPQPYDVMAVNKERAASQTALIQLEELKRSQATEAEVRAFLAQHPELALGGGMQSTLGGGMPQVPGSAPLMQQQVMPGQPPGAPQMVPGGQDLSRFATPGGPPMQSTLGAPGPQPQGPPQNPLLDLVRRDPAAAMAIQARVEKMQDARLERTAKEGDYVGRILQGVKDDVGLGQARAEIARVSPPEYAAQLPATYSKEALEPFISRAIAVKDMAEWKYKLSQARKADVEARILPEVFRAADAWSRGTQTPESPTATTNGAAPPTGRQTGAVLGTDTLSPQFRTKADSIADRLGANRDDFYRVVSFETGGEFSPATRNRAGGGATGLIQFTPETAKGLGTSTDALAKITPEQQLDYVEQYLEPYKGKIGTLKGPYMAILYPAALGKSEDTVLFSPDKTPRSVSAKCGTLTMRARKAM